MLRNIVTVLNPVNIVNIRRNLLSSTTTRRNLSSIPNNTRKQTTPSFSSSQFAKYVNKRMFGVKPVVETAKKPKSFKSFKRMTRNVPTKHKNPHKNYAILYEILSSLFIIPLVWTSYVCGFCIFLYLSGTIVSFVIHSDL